MLLETIYKLEELFTEVTADHIIRLNVFSAPFPLYWKAEVCVATAIAPNTREIEAKNICEWKTKAVVMDCDFTKLAKIYDYLEPRVHSSQVFGNSLADEGLLTLSSIGFTICQPKLYIRSCLLKLHAS